MPSRARSLDAVQEPYRAQGFATGVCGRTGCGVRVWRRQEDRRRGPTAEGDPHWRGALCIARCNEHRGIQGCVERRRSVRTVLDRADAGLVTEKVTDAAGEGALELRRQQQCNAPVLDTNPTLRWTNSAARSTCPESACGVAANRPALPRSVAKGGVARLERDACGGGSVVEANPRRIPDDHRQVSRPTHLRSLRTNSACIIDG